jgi:hypothetical protein
MQHLIGISTEQYLQGINAFWQFYKEHAHNYPLQFKNYIAETSLRYRLSYNPHDDKWYLLKVTFPFGFKSNKANIQENDNTTSNSSRNTHKSAFAR